ncbi:glycosyltransferase [Flavobacterium sp.]|uniref:glycosyltransferase family 2 protein n=1 Tax=Flavobacterium sp. TaxID=239 RepID=UPI0008B6C4C1|nr:glycosyltransferase [Flavobacterium sp.]OGS65804.1 MAG: hypothetical protein A2X21_02405 [Flavobacteria bacterium GWA2_35_26]HCF03055.1 hypothetical protein [Flavobacterium sp.]
MPQVSVIVTSYNRQSLLTETLNAILNQTFQNIEIIVVDANSNYDFFALINSFNNSKIKAFQNENHGIIATNRNFGLKQVTGRYIAFCDDDDVWLPNKLEQQMKVVQNNQVRDEPIIVHTNTILFGDDIKESVTKKTNITKFDDFFSGNPLTYSSVLLSNSEWVHFDENPAKRASEDADLWMNLFIKKYNFFLIKKPLVRYRVATSSESRLNLSFSYIRYIYVVIDAILIFKIKKFSNIKFAILIMKSLFKFSVRKSQNK